jgi:hypothetical protein
VNATETAAHGRRVQAADTDRFAANVLPVIAALQSAGITDLRGLAAVLNGRGVPTARGGKWHVSNVRNVIARGKSCYAAHGWTTLIDGKNGRRDRC